MTSRQKLTAVAMMAFVTLLLALCSRRPNLEQGSAADRQFAWTEKGKAAVTALLRDPASAEFRGVYFRENPNSAPVTCGEVNAKNGFGGMAGYQRFVSAGKPELTGIEGQFHDFELLWNQFCR